MNFTSKCVVVLLICFALVAAPLGTAMGQETFKEEKGTTPGLMAVDLVLLRPVGLVSIIVGSALFVCALPFSASGGNVGESGQKLVVAPSKFTFARPLGNF